MFAINQSCLSQRQRGFSMLALLIVLPVLLVMLGTSFTVNLALNTQHNLGLATESAALYFAKRKAQTDQVASENEVKQYLQQFSSLGQLSQVQVIPLNQGYRIKATSEVPLLMLPEWVDGFSVSNEGAAKINAVEPALIDIVLMLDLTGSLKLSLSNMLAQLRGVITDLAQDFEPGTIRIGLMPFSGFPSISNAPWLDASFEGTTCVSSNDFSVDNLFTPPSVLGEPTHFLRPTDTTWVDEGCPDISALLPTIALKEVQSRLAQHREPSNVGVTIYHHALIYAARMLDPDWLSEWGDGNTVRKSSKKVIIAIGDGEDAGRYQYEFRDYIDEGLCDKIRAHNIELYQLYYGSDYRSGSNIERCVTADNSMSLNELSLLITRLTEGLGATEQGDLTLKLIP